MSRKSTPKNRMAEVGSRYGPLLVLSYRGFRGPRRTYLCRCDCGQERVLSEITILRQEKRQVKCCCPQPRLKHGQRQTREYHIWQLMIGRCRNSNHPDFGYYGGRGITICERWLSFVDFYADMGSAPSAKHTLDRWPDPNGNYEPGNVRWATRKEQARNTRSNRTLTYNGQTHCISEWAEVLGISANAISCRLRRGWDIERTLSTPWSRKGVQHEPHPANAELQTS